MVIEELFSSNHSFPRIEMTFGRASKQIPWSPNISKYEIHQFAPLRTFSHHWWFVQLTVMKMDIHTQIGKDLKNWGPQTSQAVCGQPPPKKKTCCRALKRRVGDLPGVSRGGPGCFFAAVPMLPSGAQSLIVPPTRSNLWNIEIHWISLRSFKNMDKSIEQTFLQRTKCMCPTAQGRYCTCCRLRRESNRQHWPRNEKQRWIKFSKLPRTFLGVPLLKVLFQGSTRCCTCTACHQLRGPCFSVATGFLLHMKWCHTENHFWLL